MAKRGSYSRGSFSRELGERWERLERKWEDLHAVQFFTANGRGINEIVWREGKGDLFRLPRSTMATLYFSFKSGGTASVCLPDLSREQAQDFLMALDRFCDQGS